MPSDLQTKVTAAFNAAFQATPSCLVQAPGRVNLIGEHTDYNDGFVMPCAIDFHTLVAARAREDRVVHVVAVDYEGAQDRFELDAPIALLPDKQWANYIRGVVKMMQGAGIALRGADLVVAGNVPQGAGLSSSASLEVAIAQTLKSLNGVTSLNATDIALLAQKAENQFVGCNCGIMDQLISARGEAAHALLIDCRSLAVKPVPMPQDLAVMIVHSRVERGLVDSEYNTRRAQCEAAARHYGVKALRDVSLEALQALAHGLEPLVYQRARHVVTENQRTLEAAAALERGDLQALGVLMAQSHLSMRDDFEITVPKIDELVQIAQQAIGAEGGARMTGGGFGGCMVALMPQSKVKAVEAAILSQYRSPQGEPALIYVCRASKGAGQL